jgi:Zn-dependent protease
MWFLQPDVSFYMVVIRVLAILAIIFLVLPLHGFCRAYICAKLGDNTAKINGQMTMNPLSHFEPLGALGLLVFDFGWGKSIFIEPKNFKHPRKDMMLVSIGGPLSYVAAGIAGGILLNILVFVGRGLPNVDITWIHDFIVSCLILCVKLAVFNLVPIPPMDGFKILELMVPQKYIDKGYKYYNTIVFSLLILFFFGFFNVPIMFLQNVVYCATMWTARLPFLIFL